MADRVKETEALEARLKDPTAFDRALKDAAAWLAQCSKDGIKAIYIVNPNIDNLLQSAVVFDSNMDAEDRDATLDEVRAERAARIR